MSDGFLLFIYLGLQWEKKCKLLKNEAINEGSRGLLIGPVNDIHNELNFDNIDNFDKNNIHYLNSSFSNGVVPLQNHTNEGYQVSHSELSEVTEVGPLLHDANLYTCSGTQFDTNPRGSKDLAGAYLSTLYIFCYFFFFLKLWCLLFTNGNNCNFLCCYAGYMDSQQFIIPNGRTESCTSNGVVSIPIRLILLRTCFVHRNRSPHTRLLFGFTC